MMNVVAILRDAGKVPTDACDVLFGRATVRLVSAAEDIGYFDWREKISGVRPWRRLRTTAARIAPTLGTQRVPAGS